MYPWKKCQDSALARSLSPFMPTWVGKCGSVHFLRIFSHFYKSLEFYLSSFRMWATLQVSLCQLHANHINFHSCVEKIYDVWRLIKNSGESVWKLLPSEMVHMIVISLKLWLNFPFSQKFQRKMSFRVSIPFLSAEETEVTLWDSRIDRLLNFTQSSARLFCVIA